MADAYTRIQLLPRSKAHEQSERAGCLFYFASYFGWLAGGANRSADWRYARSKWDVSQEKKEEHLQGRQRCPFSLSLFIFILSLFRILSHINIPLLSPAPLYIFSRRLQSSRLKEFCSGACFGRLQPIGLLPLASCPWIPCRVRWKNLERRPLGCRGGPCCAAMYLYFGACACIPAGRRSECWWTR